LMSKEHASVFAPGDHGGTFGGNPLACAVGFAVMNYLLDNDIAGNAKKIGAYLMEKLKALKNKYPFITDVRGCGLLIAVEFDSEIGQNVLMTCLENGLLVNKVKPNAIRLMPPLIIGNKEVDEAIGILDKVFSGIAS
jgi:acetylornithine/N-succinyldiaminopimelate aminotransferase